VGHPCHEVSSVTSEDAIKAASELLGRWLKKTPSHTLAPNLRRTSLVSVERLAELHDPAKASDFANLVKAANRGDRDATVSACEWAYLAVCSQAGIPQSLKEYVTNLLFEKAEAGRKRRGKHPDEQFSRNYAIMYAVARVAEHGFEPTRTQTHRDCACSIVSLALEKIGVHMSEDNVERIWGERFQLPVVLRNYIEGVSRFPPISSLEKPASEE
jgi:hypothetical protein